MSSNFKYNFPANKRAKEATLTQQLAKLQEELAEIFDANEELDEPGILEETLDLIYSCEGVLRKWPKRQVDAMYEEVTQKAIARHDIF